MNAMANTDHAADMPVIGGGMAYRIRAEVSGKE